MYMPWYMIQGKTKEYEEMQKDASDYKNIQ